MKEGWLVHHHECRCAERRCASDSGERELWVYDSGWSSDGVALWLGRRQNGDVVESWGEWPKLRWPFIAVEGESRAIWGGWAAVVVQIQCSSFGSRGEATGWSITGRWSGGNELILAPYEGSVTRRDGVTTSASGEAVPGRGKGVDNTYWTDMNLTGQKMKKIHAVDSISTNWRWRFNTTMC
jgi:hypothetical protein